jgi:hypothetical protein
LITFFARNKKTGQHHFYYRCTTTFKSGSDKCPSRSLPASELEDFTDRLLFHTATDDQFFEPVAQQVIGNASDTLGKRCHECSEPGTNLGSVRKQINNIVSNLARLEMKPADLSELKGKIDGLKKQAGELDARIGVLDREIDRLERRQIDRKELRRVLREFAEI